MPVAIGKAVGTGGQNDLADMKAVGGLLNKAMGEDAALPTESTPATAAALAKRIAVFQRLVMPKADGNVGPSGTPLKRLNTIVDKPVTLSPITTGKIRHGGYVISARGYVPPRGYTLLLGPSINADDNIDVTKRFRRRASDLLTLTSLAGFLRIIDKRKAWGGVLGVRLFVVRNNKAITESAIRNVACPVEPINSHLLPLDTKGNGAKMPYQGDPKSKSFWGRLLTEVDGFERNLFTWGGRFETDKTKRGFDCITYCAAVNRVSPRISLANAAALLAQVPHEECYLHDPPTTEKRAGATKLRRVNAMVVADYFKNNRPGYYLMWKGSHTVMVFGGEVHEFSGSKKGYNVTAVGAWLASQGSKLSVVKLQGTPGRAT